MRNVADEEAYTRRCRRIGEWVEALEGGGGLDGLDSGKLRDYRFKMPTEDDPMVLLVVRAEQGADRLIAFIGAGNCGSALLAWRKRCQKGGLAWREDKPWGERGGQG